MGDLLLVALVLVWAKWSKLDIGLRAPRIAGAWGWTLLFIAWISLERIVLSFSPSTPDLMWLEELEQLSLAQFILLLVVTGPVAEELFFRGALFATLMRRWGPWVAVIAPTILWALMHYQYEPWIIASIAGSGLVLAIIRWKSGSLYIPMALHTAANAFDIALSNLP